MKILLTGSNGQLGTALQETLPIAFELITCTRTDFDLSDSEACKQAVRRIRPDWVLNAGAYTAVDNAEREPALAYAINAGAPAAFIDALNEFGGRLFQISTDFVFNGHQGFPYKVDDQLTPLGVYGASKAAGEMAAMQSPESRLMRTSWVYGPCGKNFLLTMLNLHSIKSAQNQSLNVVADQLGCPTSTYTLAKACWQAIALEGNSLKHRKLHWSDSGAATWYDFAVAIGELGVDLGLLERAAMVNPINTEDFPTLAQRPNYSLLDCTFTRQILGIEPMHWRKALSNVLQRVRL